MIDSMAAERSPQTAVSAAPVLELKQVSRTFGSTCALSEVDVVVEAGQICAVLGPNGAGKTTMLRTVIGLTQPTSGTVRVLGRPVARLGARHGRDRVALVPSGDRTFYMRLSGFENLLFFARLLGMPVRVAKQRVRQCLSDVDLSDVAGKPVSTYSHGMQKRLSVARALLGQPALLLVDESTHDLDPAAARRVQELVSAVAGRSAAVLWATQRLDEIRAFADRVIVLNKGRVLFSGTVPELLAQQPKERYVLRLRPERPLGDVPLADAAARLVRGVTVVPVDAEHVLVELGPDAVLGRVICDLTQCGVAVLACREERSGIESAFLSIVEAPDQ